MRSEFEKEVRVTFKQEEVMAFFEQFAPLDNPAANADSEYGDEWPMLAAQLPFLFEAA